MSEFKHTEFRKNLLIDRLLSAGVYKTADERHLYDAPLKILEEEYKLLQNKSGSSNNSTVIT
ncbi:Fur-regulated basic protein FbpA [Peribacillus saganii]|uniref:Fur-regulated basic protein FbpA n=1 Tax=Peribacillus saganii TaxID=2303992 RepID=A0A372LRY8_9BACI|nr:Fur-regulated basic protein FbpA [Peribacillus saganii]RFU70948.1 Fur-regulated basic protein FbpA [Peribacillus saganii]